MLAGIDMVKDLKDPDIWEAVEGVLAGFDPDKPVEEDDLIFTARSMRQSFERQATRKTHKRTAIKKCKVDNARLKSYQEKEL